MHRLLGPVGITLGVVAAGLIVWLVLFVHRHEARLVAEAELEMAKVEAAPARRGPALPVGSGRRGVPKQRIRVRLRGEPIGDPLMPNALILGASRGLGLGLAAELVRRKWSVLGTVRREADKAGLTQAGAKAAPCDITDGPSVVGLKPNLPGQLDLLFVNAGISEPADFADIDEAGIGHLFMTNAVAPVRAALALMDCVQPDGMIAFMSSRMGSVSLTAADNKALYRASKAALNSITRAMMPRFGLERAVLSFHPGWVATDMGGGGADLDVATSVKGIADVIGERRGKAGSAFLDYSGAALGW